MGVASSVMNRVPVRALVPLIAWQYRFFEGELGRLDDLVPRGRTAVDAGVWWGPWTWWLSRRSARVESFEPNPDLVARIRPAMPAHVTIHQVALSDTEGETELWVPARGTGTEGRASLEQGGRDPSAWRQVRVATRRLDDFDLPDVGFIKIDVEGHELPVLRGAANLIAAQRPTVMIEVEEHQDRDGPLDTIIDFFAQHSYRGQFLQQGSWKPIEELDRAATRNMAQHVARHGYATNLLLYARRYVHNFVFVPADR